jgi:acetylornithine deacetylase
MRVEQLIHEEIKRLKDIAVDWTRELIRIPSITGNEKQVQSLVAHFMREIGMTIDVWNPQKEELSAHPAFSDDGLPLGDRPVVVGHWKGSVSAAQSLILNGHVDVVPAGDPGKWRDDPWSGAVHEGKIWGRGACDMKGGLVAGMIALHALRKLSIRPSGDVWIESVIGEETGGVGTLASVLRGYSADAAIVLEPTSLNICPSGAGAASFRLTVTGKPAHAAMRREGVSAIEKFYPLLGAMDHLETTRQVSYHHPLFQPGELIAPISIGKIEAGDWPSTVPERLVAEGRFGILPGEKMDRAKVEFENAIATCATQDPWLSLHRPVVEWFEGQFEPAETPHDAPFVSMLAQAHYDICSRKPDVRGVTYGSDLRFFTNYAGMQAVLYGPGDVSVAHSLDEHISIQEILSAAEVVACAILRWCGAS